jgi:Brp/Blh family beta-carotene 15,15'-monooxygenase
MAVSTPAGGADPIEEPDVRRRLAIAAFVPGWAGLLLVLAVTVAGLSLSTGTRYWLFVAATLTLGLPHGALDHLTVPRAGAREMTGGYLLAFVALYFAGVMAFLAVWGLAPAVAFLTFLALTWYHWGQGDRFPLFRLAGGTHLRDRWVARGTTFVRGGVPMVVPLLAFPARYRVVATDVVGLFGAGGLALAPLFRTDVRLGIAVLVGVVTLLTLARGWFVAEAGVGWWLDAGETTLLWLTFAVVPPLVAIAAYFACWHAVRHLVRLVALDTPSLTAIRTASDRGLPCACRVVGGRLARDAFPATAGAGAIIAAIWLVAPGSGPSIAAVAGTLLVGLAALTVPHTVVVTWLDRVQAV